MCFWIQRANELNPTDATTLYTLGYWWAPASTSDFACDNLLCGLGELLKFLFVFQVLSVCRYDLVHSRYCQNNLCISTKIYIRRSNNVPLVLKNCCGWQVVMYWCFASWVKHSFFFQAMEYCLKAEEGTRWYCSPKHRSWWHTGESVKPYWVSKQVLFLSVDPMFYSKNLVLIGRLYLRLNDRENATKYFKMLLTYPLKTDDDQKVSKPSCFQRSFGIWYLRFTTLNFPLFFDLQSHCEAVEELMRLGEQVD